MKQSEFEADVAAKKQALDQATMLSHLIQRILEPGTYNSQSWHLVPYPVRRKIANIIQQEISELLARVGLEPDPLPPEKVVQIRPGA